MATLDYNNYSPIRSSGISSTTPMNSMGSSKNIQQNQNPVIFSKGAEVGKALSMSAAHSNIARLVTKNENGATGITNIINKEEGSFAEDITLSSALEKLKSAQDYNEDMKAVVLKSIEKASTNEDKIAVLEKGLAFLETEKKLSECVQSGKMELESAKKMLTVLLNNGCKKDFSLEKLNKINEKLAQLSENKSSDGEASSVKENISQSKIQEKQVKSSPTKDECMLQAIIGEEKLPESEIATMENIPQEEKAVMKEVLKESKPKIFSQAEHGNLTKNACESQQQSGTKPDLLPVNNSQPEVVNQFAMDLMRGEKIEGWEVPSSVKKEDTPLDQKIKSLENAYKDKFTEEEFAKLKSCLDWPQKGAFLLIESGGFGDINAAKAFYDAYTGILNKSNSGNDSQSVNNETATFGINESAKHDNNDNISDVTHKKITFKDNKEAQKFNDGYPGNVRVLGQGAKARVELYEGTGLVRKVFTGFGEDDEINVAKEVIDNIKFLSQKDQGYLEAVALPKGVINIPSNQNNNGDTQAIIYEKAEGKNFQDATLEIEWAIRAFDASLTKGFDKKGVLSGNEFVDNIKEWLKGQTKEALTECCIGVLLKDKSAEKVKNAFEKHIIPFLAKKENITHDNITNIRSELKLDFYQKNAPNICKSLQGAFKGIVGLHKAGFIYDDLKPDNMMMGPPPKVIDLGACIDITKQYNSKTVASAGYTPNEAANNTQASDVHKMGLCVAQTLLGEFGNEFILSLASTKVKGIAGNIQKKFDFKPGEKREYIEQLYEALPELLKDEQFKDYIPSVYSEAQLEFLGNLIKDCINPDLTQRPTSEQMLAIFEQFSAEPNASVPSYEKVKAQAIKDHPKDLPPVLMAKIFSKDKKEMQQAFAALEQLVKDDPSYIKTPTYGLAMLRHDQKKITKEAKYEQWKNDNKEANAQLLDRVCLEGMEFQDGKSIPLTLHKMQLLKDANKDGENDQNFKTRPMYGLYLFKKGETEKFQTWSVKEVKENGKIKYYDSEPFVELKERICLEGTSHYTDNGINLSADDIINLGEFDEGIQSTAAYKLAKALDDQRVQLTSGKELEKLRERAYIVGSLNPPENGIAFDIVTYKEIYAQTHCLSLDEAKELVGKVYGTKPLGEGSFGAVYKVKGKDGKTYAVKIAKAENNAPREAFEQEKAANEYLQASLFEEERKYFVNYYGGFKIDGNYVLITEFINSPGNGRSSDFNEQIKGVHEDGKCTKKDCETMTMLFQQGFERVAVEQRIGLLNRDIKPENMMVAGDQNGGLQLKAMDYGCACTYSGIGNPSEKGVGSPSFMSPEILNKEPYSFPSDVYSMGISLLNGLFGGIYSKTKFPFPWNIAEYVSSGKLSEDLKDKTFDKLVASGVITQEQLNTLKENLDNNEQKIGFLASLVADCMAFNPQERITAGQAAYLLEKFNKGKYDYSAVRRKAIQNHPKAIPDPIMDRVNSSDSEIQEQGVNALKSLILADPSYIETETFNKLKESVAANVKNSEEYGWGLLRINKEEGFKAWAESNPTIVATLANKVSINDKVDKGAFSLSSKALLLFADCHQDFKNNVEYGLALAKERKKDDFKEWSEKHDNIDIKNLKESLVYALGAIDETYQRNEKYGIACLKEGNIDAFVRWGKNNGGLVSAVVKTIQTDGMQQKQGWLLLSPDDVIKIGEQCSEIKKENVYGFALIRRSKNEDFEKLNALEKENKKSICDNIRLSETKVMGGNFVLSADEIIELANKIDTLKTTYVYGQALILRGGNNDFEEFNNLATDVQQKTFMYLHIDKDTDPDTNKLKFSANKILSLKDHISAIEDHYIYGLALLAEGKINEFKTWGGRHKNLLSGKLWNKIQKPGSSKGIPISEEALKMVEEFKNSLKTTAVNVVQSLVDDTKPDLPVAETSIPNPETGNETYEPSVPSAKNDVSDDVEDQENVPISQSTGLNKYPAKVGG